MSELSTRARHLIAAGRAGLEPGAGARDRMRQRVMSAVGIATVGGASGSAAAAGAGSSATGAAASSATAVASAGGVSAKLIGSGLSVLLVAGAGVAGYRALLEEPPPPHRARVTQPAPAPLVTASPGALGADAAVEVELDPELSPAAGETASRPAPHPEVRRPPARAARPAATEVVPASDAKQPAEPADRSAEAARQHRLEAEVRLLRAARAALRRGDTQAALDALEDYARTIEGGELEPEAALVRVEVLCRLGRPGDALGVARAAAARWPASPVAERAAAPCRSQGDR